MKKIISVLIIGLLLVGTSAFANDVTIDSSGNVTTGVNASGNIEVTGASGETGVFSQTSGTGAIAVRGENTSYGSFGTLGGYVNPQDVGVYGYSLGGWAGYFEGTVRITSDLTVDGTITGLDAAYVNEGQSGSVTSIMILDGTMLPADVSFNYAGSTTKGGAATDLVCTACVSQTELDFTAGTGDITGVTAGTGLTGGGMSGDVTLGVMVPLTIDGSYAGTIVSGINSGTGYGVLGLRGSFELGNRGYLGHTDYGVYGIGEIGTATGVYGRNLFSGNFGYLGGSLHGVYGESGSGIGGYFTSTTGYGLIVASGNAGFGTLSPTEQLHVSNHMQVGNPASIWASAADNRLIKFGDGEYASIGEYGGDDDLRIKGNPIYLDGNVGIGTSNPSQKLTVAGTIESTSGGIKFPDGTVQTTAAAPSWHQILPAAERFVLVMGNAAVLDNETGLVWEKSPSAGIGEWESITWICIRLELGGRKGWHLPTIEQLASLVDSTNSSPALPTGHPFSNVQSGYYWSATTSASYTTHAWSVNFNNGYVTTVDKTLYKDVWCVRGGSMYDVR